MDKNLKSLSQILFLMLSQLLANLAIQVGGGTSGLKVTPRKRSLEKQRGPKKTK